MLMYLQMIETPEERSKFELLYINYRALMYHVAYEILGNKDDAEDAVHHAFLKVVENIKKVGDPVCPQTKSYLVTIVENRSLDICRMRARHQTVPFAEEYIGLNVEYSGSFDLANCFARLPGRYREVLILRYRHGYNIKEIAGMLGVTYSNAMKLEQRAKHKLFQLCQEEGLL